MGKFMAWKDPEMEACQTIFYLMGILSQVKEIQKRLLIP
jgi:hypothetical protein